MKLRNVIWGIILIISCQLAHSQTYNATIKTTEGVIKVLLYDSTPLHRDNFIKLVQEKFYDSLLFHRVIDGFVIQGGDPTSKKCSDTATLGDGDLGYTIPAEFVYSYYHKRGALAQARDERPDKASSACQFYIVHGKKANDSAFIKAFEKNQYLIPEKQKEVYRTIGGTPRLDRRYTVYGEVIQGMNIVDKIATSATNKSDRPIKNIRIISIRMNSPKKHKLYEKHH